MDEKEKTKMMVGWFIAGILCTIFVTHAYNVYAYRREVNAILENINKQLPSLIQQGVDSYIRELQKQ